MVISCRSQLLYNLYSYYNKYRQLLWYFYGGKIREGVNVRRKLKQLTTTRKIGVGMNIWLSFLPETENNDINTQVFI